MKKFLNSRPLLFICVDLIFGICSAYYFLVDKVAVGILFLTLAFLFSATFLISSLKNKKVLFGSITASVMLVCSVVGFTVTFIKTENYEKANLHGHIYDISGRICEVTEGEYYKSAIIEDVYLSGVDGGKSSYKIKVFISGTISADIGDKVSFSGKLTDISAYSDDRLQSSYINSSVKYSSYVSADDMVIEGNSKTVFESINRFIKNTLKTGMEEQEFAIAYAMTTGNSDYMDEDVLTGFRSAGVAHIFAVSGLHVSVFAAAIGFLLKKAKLKNTVVGAVTFLCCFVYSGVCGFSASSLRAVIMYGVKVVAEVTGRKYDAVSSVALAATVILLIFPFQFFNIGFRLSFVVVLGIILLSKHFKKLFSFLPEKLASALSTALSAQLASIPVCLTAFGNLSLISILFNVVFLPAISVVFIFMFACILLSGITGLGSYILLPAFYILKAIKTTVTFIDLTQFTVKGCSLGLLSLLFYFALITFSKTVNVRATARRASVIILAAVCLVGSIGIYFTQNDMAHAYVCSEGDFSAVLFTDDGESVLIVSNADDASSVYKYSKVVTESALTEIDYLVIMDTDASDICELCSTINQITVAHNIYYYGELDAETGATMMASFSEAFTMPFDTDEYIKTENFEISLSHCGKAAAIKTREKDFLIVSELNDNGNFPSTEEVGFAVIATNYYEYLLEVASSERIIGFRQSDRYECAESRGYIEIKFN